MYRFIDMRSSRVTDADPRFAFWDTAKDKFVEVGGEQAWNNWTEVEDAIDLPHSYPFQEILSAQSRRLRSLCPFWVFAPDDGVPDEAEKHPQREETA